MNRFSFHPTAALIILPCQIEFRSRLFIDLAIDTGASMTIISEKAAIEIGFDLAKIVNQTSFSDASQSHIVPVVTLKSISLGRAKVNNLQALCYTLPEEHGIDGVVGLNFFRLFKKVIFDFEQAQLILENYQDV